MLVRGLSVHDDFSFSEKPDKVVRRPQVQQHSDRVHALV